VTENEARRKTEVLKGWVESALDKRSRASASASYQRGKHDPWNRHPQGKKVARKDLELNKSLTGSSGAGQKKNPCRRGERFAKGEGAA